MSSKYKNSIIIFVILAYGITWAIAFPLSFIYNYLNYIVSEIWHSLAPIGPTIASLIAIKYWKGKDGLNELKTRCLIKKKRN